MQKAAEDTTDRLLVALEAGLTPSEYRRVVEVLTAAAKAHAAGE